jgi:hypothetical protein
MTDSAVVSGLVAKRRELAAQVEHHRRELVQLAQELGHLEATIRMFDPSYQVGSPHRRARAARQQWFRTGECQRFVLETLRDASEPLSDGALSQAVAARKGLNDPAVLVSVQKTVLAVLRRLVLKGVARSVMLPSGTRGWERG